MPGKKINNLLELEAARIAKKSVICPELRCWSHRVPAAFVINQQGPVLLRMFKSGMYIYKKKT